MSFTLLKQMSENNFTFDTSMTSPSEPNPAAHIFSSPQQTDQPDVVSFDIPTFIRILEWAHEEVQDDVELHKIANAFIIASFEHSPLTMREYEAIIGTQREETSDDQPTNRQPNPWNSTEMFQN